MENTTADVMKLSEDKVRVSEITFVNTFARVLPPGECIDIISETLTFFSESFTVILMDLQ